MAVGKKITDLTASGSLKDTDLAIVHDGNGTKRSTLTQISEYMGAKFSNPNLLINPDFKINQRGSSTYTTTSDSPIYTVDRWMITRGRATVNSDKTVTITATGGTTNKEGYYQQRLENAISGDYTVSMEVISVSGAVRIAIDGAWQNVKSGLNVFHGITGTGAVGLQLANGASITLKWVKLEQGSIATPFVAPNPAEELMRCKRYFQTCINMFNFIGSSNEFSHATHFSEMRIKPTIETTENYKANVNSYRTASDSIFDRYYISTIINSVNGAFVLLKLKFELDAEIY